MAFRTADGTWRATVRVGSQRLSSNHRTRARAEKWAHEVREGKRPDPSEGRNVTVKEFFESWFDSYASVELADSTAKGLAALAHKHLFPRIGKVPMRMVDREVCLQLRKSLAAELAPSYANNVLNLARRLFKVAVQDRVISENPWPGVKRLKVPKRPFKYWTRVQRNVALTHLAKVDPALGELVAVAVHTGLRWGELYALRREHLDFEAGTLTVCANYRPSVRRMVDTTKNGKAEVLPMNPDVRRVLSTRRDWPAEAPVFESRLLEAARYRLPKLCAETGLPRIRFHDLRHSYASNLREAGVDLGTVMQLMRHSSIEMTLIYAHIGRDDLALAAARLCDIPVTDVAPEAPKMTAEEPKFRVIPGGYEAGPIVKWRAASA